MRKHVFRNVIPSEVEGSFALAVRRRAFEKEKRETPYRGRAEGGASSKRLSEGGGKRGTKKISRCARNDSVENGYPDDSVGNEYPDDSVGNGDPVHHTKNV